MKKIITICFLMLCTGCFSEEFSGIITKTCTNTKNGVQTNITIKSFNGNINSIMIEENYDDLSKVLDSKMSEKNLYSQLNGISLDIDNNTVIYNIDVNNTTDLVKERFNIHNEQHKQIEYYENNDFTCK